MGGLDGNARFVIGGEMLPLGIRARGGAAIAGPGGNTTETVDW